MLQSAIIEHVSVSNMTTFLVLTNISKSHCYDFFSSYVINYLNKHKTKMNIWTKNMWKVNMMNVFIVFSLSLRRRYEIYASSIHIIIRLTEFTPFLIMSASGAPFLLSIFMLVMF